MEGSRRKRKKRRKKRLAVLVAGIRRCDDEPKTMLYSRLLGIYYTYSHLENKKLPIKL